MTKGKKAAVAISAAVLTAGLGLGAAGLASAETPTPTNPPATSTPSQTATSSPQEGFGHHARRARGALRSEELAALADKLGIDVSKLEDALSAMRQARRAEREAAFAKELASELGIDEAKVTAAFEELRAEHREAREAADKAVLDQAVKDGTLTQAEADAVQKAADAGIARIRHGR